MQNIIVSDIFGKTKALVEIAASFSNDVEVEVVVDPYNAEIMDFKNEAEAYSYFVSEIGLDAYAEHLLEKLAAKAGPVSLLGFSVGASAIWKISDLPAANNISTATCFYGSQIRHYLDITPLFPVQLFLPATEQHFSVTELITALSGINNVQIQQVAFLHGFMNRHSQHFDPTAYCQFMKKLSDFPLHDLLHTAAFDGIKASNINCK